MEATKERDLRRAGAKRRSKLSAYNSPAFSQRRMGRLPVSSARGRIWSGPGQARKRPDPADSRMRSTGRVIESESAIFAGSRVILNSDAGPTVAWRARPTPIRPQCRPAALQDLDSKSFGASQELLPGRAGAATRQPLETVKEPCAPMLFRAAL
jgi:hypothetical protein